MTINEKRFNFVYFGLFVILIGVAVYTAIDFLPSFAISSTIITPNDSTCQYEGPYNHTSGNFQCATIPQGSNQTIPKSWSAPINEYPSNYNSITGITGFSQFPIISGSSSSLSVLPSSYIIYQKNGFTLAQNGLTGNIDYNSTDSSTVIQNAINSANQGLVFIKGGIYYINKPITIPNSIDLEGEGIRSTILMANQTLPSILNSPSGGRIYIGHIDFMGNCKAQIPLDLSHSSETDTQIKIDNIDANNGLKFNVDMDGNEGSALTNSLIETPCGTGNAIHWFSPGGNIWINDDSFAQGDTMIGAQQAVIRDSELGHFTSLGSTILEMDDNYMLSANGNVINATLGFQDGRFTDNFIIMKPNDNFIVGVAVTDIQIEDNYFAINPVGPATIVPNQTLFKALYAPSIMGTLHLEGVSSNSGQLIQDNNNADFTLK